MTIAAFAGYALLVLFAFTAGVIAENRAAKKAKELYIPNDYELTVHLGGQRALFMRASHLVQIGGTVKGDAVFTDAGVERFAQLVVQVAEVPRG